MRAWSWLLAGLVVAGCLDVRVAPSARLPQVPSGRSPAPMVVTPGDRAGGPSSASRAVEAAPASPRETGVASLELLDGRMEKAEGPEPDGLRTGDTAAFSMRVRNTGTQPIDRLIVRVETSDPRIAVVGSCVGCLTELGLPRPLPPGQTEDLGRVGLRAEPGLEAGLEFKVIATATARGVKGVEKRFAADLSPLPPDLEWEEATQASDLQPAKQGPERFTGLVVTVRNKGQSPAKGLTAELLSDAEAVDVGRFCRTCRGDQPVPVIEPGARVTLSEPFGLVALDEVKGRREVPLQLKLRDETGRTWRLERTVRLAF